MLTQQEKQELATLKAAQNGGGMPGTGGMPILPYQASAQSGEAPVFPTHPTEPAYTAMPGSASWPTLGTYPRHSTQLSPPLNPRRATHRTYTAQVNQPLPSPFPTYSLAPGASGRAWRLAQAEPAKQESPPAKRKRNN